MRNNSTKQTGKKISISHYRSQFRAQLYGDKLPKQLESLEEKKVVQTSCAHGVKRICQLYTEGGPAGKPAYYLNPLETISIIADETADKDSAPQTLDELRQWLRLAWKNVTLDTLWELVHSIPHRLENVRKHKEWHSGY